MIRLKEVQNSMTDSGSSQSARGLPAHLSSHVIGFSCVQSCGNVHRVEFLEEQLGRIWDMHL
jgi:hypothetical protein